MTIGERLYKLRKEKNISQEELANELNVSRQTISKWETGESTPDFDKIVPLCNYFNITSDELLSGKENIIVARDDEKQHKFARNLAISIILYIISLAEVVFVSEMFHLEAVAVALFFITIAIATGLIVYSSIVYLDKKDDSEETKKENESLNLICKIISILGLIVYLVISFLSGAWHLTWIIWIIVGLCNTIVKLLFSLKGDKKDE